MVKFLLAFPNPSVSVADIDGHTSLCVATSNSFSEICALLLKHYAATPVQGISEKSPIHDAAVHEDFRTVEVCLGGSLNGLGAAGSTPLMRVVAESQPALAQVLLEIPARYPNVRNARD